MDQWSDTMPFSMASNSRVPSGRRLQGLKSVVAAAAAKTVEEGVWELPWAPIGFLGRGPGAEPPEALTFLAL